MVMYSVDWGETGKGDKDEIVNVRVKEGRMSTVEVYTVSQKKPGKIIFVVTWLKFDEVITKIILPGFVETRCTLQQWTSCPP